MSAIASQITGVSIVCSTADQRKKLCVACLCEGNSPVTSEFPTQRASNTENVPIWWRHHALVGFEESWWRYNDTTQYWTIWNGSMWIILLYQWKPKLNSLLSILRFLQNLLTMIITTMLLNCNYGRKRTDAKYMYKKSRAVEISVSFLTTLASVSLHWSWPGRWPWYPRHICVCSCYDGALFTATKEHPGLSDQVGEGGDLAC